MWIQAITIAIFLLYFFYFTRWYQLPVVTKPSSVYNPNQQLTFLQNMIHTGTEYVYSDNRSNVWEIPLIPDYALSVNKFIEADACFNVPDGTQILATGKPLYEFIHNHKIVYDNFTFESNSETSVQDKRIFYFKCRDSRIHALGTCAPGEIFVGQRCKPIDRCTGEVDGKRFANIYNLRRYVECRNEESIHHECAPDTVFVIDRCMNTIESAAYCQFNASPKILDPQTLLKCEEGEIVYVSCPPGFRYFKSLICESEICVGKPDGTRVQLPNETHGPFTYSPGYLVCGGQKITKAVRCPENWDLWRAQDLTHLPQVFDGRQCSVPSFCRNVFSHDPQTIVPVFVFSKHVQNWKHSEWMDSVTGHECVGKSRKRTALEPGTRINKRFKREFACDGTVSKVPVSGRKDAYYDCKSHTVRECADHHYFDADACVPHREHAFQYKGLDFFSFDSMREDNWIQPWDYDKTPTVQPCTDPENVYLETYNVCSHPDCVRYPFLSMISFHVTLRDGSKCVFRDDARRLMKFEATEPFLFWSQRPGEGNDPCVPGSRLKTGNFVWDSTLYMTCDEREPFVFCPSSDTVSIEKVDGNKYACIPASPFRATIPIQTKITFVKNEIKKIVSDENAFILINKQDFIVPPDGIEMSDGFELETLLQTVQVEYNYRMTHPPDVILQEGHSKVSTFGGAFLMKRKDFTKKPLKFPSYKVQRIVRDFEL